MPQKTSAATVTIASIMLTSDLLNATTNVTHDEFGPFVNNSFNTRLYSDGMILAYNVFLSAIITFGVPGNLLVLVVLTKLRVSSTTDMFIIFITIFDLISSCANVPVYLTFTNGTWAMYGTDVLCKSHMYLSQIVVLTSVLLTGELALERYLIICRPHGTTISVKKARNVCLGTCALSAIISIPILQVYKNNMGRCTSGKLNLVECIYFIAVFLMYIIVFIVIVVCYTKICLTIKRSQEILATHRQPAQGQLKKQSKISFIRVKFNQVMPSQVPTANEALPETNTTVNKDNTTSSVPNSSNGKDSIKYPSTHRSTDSNSLEKRSNCVELVQHHTIRFNRNALKNSNKSQLSTLRQKVRTTKIAFLVCSIFIISWIIPLSCFVLLQLLTPNIALMKFVLFGKMTYLLNTFTNPFLYVWLNKKFRQKLMELFRFFRCF